MIRLMVPPLPAASRPSKTTTTRWPLGLDPLLDLHQLGLEPEQLGLVDVEGQRPIGARAVLPRLRALGHEPA